MGFIFEIRFYTNPDIWIRNDLETVSNPGKIRLFELFYDTFGVFWSTGKENNHLILFLDIELTYYKTTTRHD